MDKVNWCKDCKVEAVYQGWYQWDDPERDDLGEDAFWCPECKDEWSVPITADGEFL